MLKIEVLKLKKSIKKYWRLKKNRQAFKEYLIGDVAQLEEHHNGIVGVVGSNPIISTESPLSWDDWAIQSF